MWLLSYIRALQKNAMYYALWSLFLSSLFQNKETNNQTQEQGALVAEEEVMISTSLSLSLFFFN